MDLHLCVGAQSCARHQGRHDPLQPDSFRRDRGWIQAAVRGTLVCAARTWGGIRTATRPLSGLPAHKHHASTSRVHARQAGTTRSVKQNDLSPASKCRGLRPMAPCMLAKRPGHSCKMSAIETWSLLRKIVWTFGALPPAGQRHPTARVPLQSPRTTTRRDPTTSRRRDMTRLHQCHRLCACALGCPARALRRERGCIHCEARIHNLRLGACLRRMPDGGRNPLPPSGAKRCTTRQISSRRTRHAWRSSAASGHDGSSQAHSASSAGHAQPRKGWRQPARTKVAAATSSAPCATDGDPTKPPPARPRSPGGGHHKPAP